MEPEKLNYNIRYFRDCGLERKGARPVISVPLDTLTDSASTTKRRHYPYTYRARS